MARFSVSAKFNASGNHDVFGGPDVLNASTTVADQATLAADQATVAADVVRIADATLTTDWAALVAAIAAVNADIAAAPATSDVVISYNATTIGTRGKLRAVVEKLLALVAGNNSLTP